MALLNCPECEREISDKAESCPHCGYPISETKSAAKPAFINDFANRAKDLWARIKANTKPWMRISCIAVVIIALVAIVLSISLCGASRYDWDEVLLKSVLPEPSSANGDLQLNTADGLYLIVCQTSFSEYNTYVDSCIDKGFTCVVESSSSSYRAFNKEGYELKLDYFEYDKAIHLSLDSRVSGAIKWSTREPALLLPVPSSNVGSIVNDHDEHYEVYVGNTSKAEFDVYISDCEARGFNQNVQRQDNSFYAQNEVGYELLVEYYACDLIYIDLDVPRESTDEESDITYDTSNSETGIDDNSNDYTSNTQEAYTITAPIVAYDSFNLTDIEFIDWINSVSDITVGYTELGTDSNVNSCYPVTLNSGETGVILFNHGNATDNNTNINDRKVCGVMAKFDDYSSSLAVVIWIAQNIDSDFSSEDAISQVISNGFYSEANMTVLFLDDSEVAILAPSNYVEEILD